MLLLPGAPADDDNNCDGEDDYDNKRCYHDHRCFCTPFILKCGSMLLKQFRGKIIYYFSIKLFQTAVPSLNKYYFSRRGYFSGLV